MLIKTLIIIPFSFTIPPYSLHILLVLYMYFVGIAAPTMRDKTDNLPQRKNRRETKACW